MIFRRIFILLSLALLCCVNHDLDNSSPEVAVSMASSMCKKDFSQMQWLMNLLALGETDPGQRGDIFAAALDGNVVFVHQPLIMSCRACVLYDCDGHRVPVTVNNHEKIEKAMMSATKIYSVH